MLCFDCKIYYYLFNISGQHIHNRELSHEMCCTFGSGPFLTHLQMKNYRGFEFVWNTLVYSVYQFVFKSTKNKNYVYVNELQLFPTFN